MIIALSNKKKAWILRQCQAAAFYQAENCVIDHLNPQVFELDR
jgi:hypothetical protein